MNDNGNIRLLTPENDIRVRVFLSSLEDLLEKVEKIRGANKPSLDGERYYTDKELAVKLKVSRRSLQDYPVHCRGEAGFSVVLLVEVRIADSGGTWMWSAAACFCIFRMKERALRTNRFTLFSESSYSV